VLKPRNTATRESTTLNGVWRFALDPSGEGRHDGWWQGPLPGTVEVPVPASYTDVFASAAARNHVGDAWYQRPVRIPATWAGKRVVLRFDAATHNAVVWIDDAQVVAHDGGYTPFEADLTELVKPGSEVRLTRRRQPQRRVHARAPAEVGSIRAAPALAGPTVTSAVALIGSLSCVCGSCLVGPQESRRRQEEP
jgi:beta-galactosidase/beta-glucuronidase